MSPSQGPSTRQRKQLQPNGRQSRQRSRRPRSRACLLKGCEKRFRPAHPMARYCSEECREKARRWSQWKSRQRWRRSENGRKKRREQSVRHRERLRLSGCARSRPKVARVGHHKVHRQKFFLFTHVIVRVATTASNEHGGRRCNDSARMIADAPWNACWSAKGDGRNAVKLVLPKPRASPPRCASLQLCGDRERPDILPRPKHFS